MRNKFMCSRILMAGLTTVAAALAGCGIAPLGSTGSSVPVTVPGVELQGSIHGGQQPVSGAAIQLYAANATGGYGSSSYALLNASVTTTSTGSFSITSDYTCPSTSSLVYLVATGGNPGLGSSNPNLALTAALGSCGSLSSSTFISVNELTTIASVYALAAFMTSYSAVGTSAANLQGLTNAFATVNNLVNVASGTLAGPTLPTSATLPTTELNTLADILAACVNSAGGAANDGSTCGSLFGYTTPSGAAAPTDTIGAALNIAKYPNRNVASLIALSPAAAPFQPTLSAATDFTLSIKYKTTGLSTPSAAAVDSTGSLWVTNAGNNSLTVMNAAGTAVAGSPYSGGGLNAPSAIAIDSTGNAWVADSGSSKLSVFTSSGAGTQTAATGLSSPSGVAIDGKGIVWVSDAGNNSVTAVTVSGTTATGSASYTTGGTNAPAAIAINPY